jgi:hypothetical protein
MSIISNGNIGAVYQPDYFEARQILSKDYALTEVATALKESDTAPATFAFNVGKNERVVYRFTLFYDQDHATDDLLYTIKSTDSDGNAVAPAFYSEHLNAILPGATASFLAVTTTPNTEDTVEASGTGQGMAVIQGVILGNASSATTVNLLLRKADTTSGDTTVQEGSFLELRRF